MYIFFFGESAGQIHILFKLLRDSPIDQIVQTVFGYSLRKEWRQQNHKHEHYLKYTQIYIQNNIRIKYICINMYIFFLEKVRAKYIFYLNYCATAAQ